MKVFFQIILLFISLTSCVSRAEKHGYMFDLSDHEMLHEGISDKETVLKFMGSPTFISDISDEEVWFYYSEEVRHFLFFMPKILQRKVFILKFDNKNFVKDLRKIDLNSENKNFNFHPDYTKVGEHKTGFFKSIFSNVGQVKPQ
jgi:outer membrane protein assembly factor BamE (lipoprotein component of BamABCDE complex)